MKVLVCGSRNFNSKEFLFKELSRVNKRREITTLIHGGARGADILAGEWAKTNSIEIVCILPDWNRYGRGAAFIRNIEMLDLEPNLVIAFPVGESKGTRHTINNALEKEIEVRILEQEEGEKNANINYSNKD